MSPYKKLLGNSALFAIGNLGSKLISIILVPLYTFYLSTTEYGLVDIVISTSSMLLPIISLSIYDSVLRFIMDKYDNNDDSVLSNGFFITMIGSGVVLILYPILSSLRVLGNLLGFMIVILILQAFQMLFGQYARAIGNVKEYALNGIIMSLVTGCVNVVLLVKLNLGIRGYLFSLIISNVVSILYLGFTLKVYQQIKLSKFDLIKTKHMLRYSIPLIPNFFMWWVINASNRFFILFFVGPAANGLFAVANKIPSLVSILNTIFIQAWQLSAIEEFNSKDKSKLYSNVFNYFSLMMFVAASAILIVLKLIFSIAVQQDYYEGWKIVPILLLGVVFSSFSGFLGTNYIAAKETRGVLKTSIYGGIVSVLSNLFFIPLFGANGAGISTVLSFFCIWVLRVIDTRKYIKMDINWNTLIRNLAIVIIQITVMYLGFSNKIELLINILLFVILLLANRKHINMFLFIFINTIKRKS